MYLPEYDNKPRYRELVLLNVSGSFELKKPEKFRVSENITKCIYTVYNIKTDAVSDKSVYNSEKGYYIKHKGKILYVENFK